MKKPLQFILLLFILNSSYVIRYTSFGQAPQGINYQAVARDASGNPLANTAVTVIFEIRPGASGNPSAYTESHSLTTNPFGLFTAVIGAGTPLLGTFSSLSWGAATHWLNVNVNGTDMGTMQFLSVPYSLYSNTAGSAPPTGNAGGDLIGTYPNPQIANDAVTTPKIQNDAVTGTKISITGESNGSMMYHNGTDWVNLSPGANGNVLQISSGIPTWTTTASHPPSWLLGGNTLTGKDFLGSNSPHDIGFKTGGFERMTILSGGNVGIGTTAPVAKLDVAGTLKLGTSGTVMTAMLHGVFSVDPPSIGAGLSTVFSVTLTGASPGDLIFLTPPSAFDNSIIYQGATVTAGNTVNIKCKNVAGTPVDAVATNWQYLIIRP